MPVFSLEACRKNTGFSLKTAAEKLGINYQTLSKYEHDSSNIPLNFLQKKITIKNPVLFRKRTTDINFGEISDIRVNKLGMFRLVYVNTNKPHEKSGMTSENGMLVSANLFFLSNKSLKKLDKVLERLKNRYVNL